jgi:hypothetical protein
MPQFQRTVLFFIAFLAVTQCVDAAAPTHKKNAESSDSGYRSVVWRGESIVTEQDPETAARHFIRQHYKEMTPGIDPGAWSKVEIRRSAASMIVDLSREIEGLPVYGECLRVILSPQGEVRSVIGRLAKAGTIPQNTAMITSGVALSIAKQAWGAEILIPGAPQPWLAMYSTSAGWRTVWVVSLPSEKPAGDGCVLVDAGNGEVLKLSDLSAHLVETTDSTTVWVFHPDPLTSAHKPYGDGYVDNGDADTQQLTDQRFEFKIDSLTVDNDSLILKGPHVWIRDLTGVVAPPAAVPVDSSFNFTRSQSGFEDVMAYYYIDQYQRRVQSLGFDSLQHVPIQVDAHAFYDDKDSLNYDNSLYDPSINTLLFGEGGIDDAEDADVLIHEYGHALMHDAMFHISDHPMNVVMGFDMACLAEGACDYLAGSYSLSIDSFGSDRVFNWDGNNSEIGWYGRPLQTSDVYNFSQWLLGDPYSNGTIWADAMWRARAVLGADTADGVVLESFFYFLADMKIDVAAEQVLLAAQSLYPNDPSVVAVYEQALVEKGFLPAVSMPDFEGASLPLRFDVESPYPNPFNPSTTLRLHLPGAATVTLRVWSVSGRLIETRPLGLLANGTHKVSYCAPPDMASGVVLFELDAGQEGRVVRKAVLLR